MGSVGAICPLLLFLPCDGRVGGGAVGGGAVGAVLREWGR
jgi:hypothetical protein